MTADGAEDIIHRRTAGMNGESSVREVDLETGAVRRKKMLQHADFAEGITRFGDKYGSLYLFPLSICLLHKLMTDGDIYLICNVVVNVGCRLFQLTWQSPKMFAYKVDDLEQVQLRCYSCSCAAAWFPLLLLPRQDPGV